MKLDGPEPPRRAGVGVALRPPWAAAPSAVALGAALGRARAMKGEEGRADRPARAWSQGPSPNAVPILATFSPSNGSGKEMELGVGCRHSLVCQAPGQVLKVSYCLIQPFL